jgi:predicted dehydrogenase
MTDPLRIAIVGAGRFTQNRSLPNLLKMPGVEIKAIANRRLATAQEVAQKFEVAEATDDWRSLIDRDDIDAVLVGTPPNVHAEITIAAMQAGKDVLSQTRMARNLDDARHMLQVARDTGRKAALARPSGYVGVGRYVKHLLSDGYVGNVRQVFCYRMIPDYTDGSLPMGRRQDPNIYGELNCLYLGYCWDVLQDWFGQPERVLTQYASFTPQRLSEPGGSMITVGTPEAVTAIAEMRNGAHVTSIQTGVTHFGQDRIEIYGDEGTLVCGPSSVNLTGARKGDDALAPIDVPDDYRDEWSVESDFVRLVRGEIDSMFLSFEDGVANMAYLDACYRSARDGRWVEFATE